MSTEETPKPQTTREMVVTALREELILPIANFFKSPIVVWGVVLSYIIEGMCYFGILTQLTTYFSDNLVLGTVYAGWIVSTFTAVMTLSQSFLGGMVDKWGIRRSLLTALIIFVLGRVLLSGSEQFLSGNALIWTVGACGGLSLVAAAYGVFQPSAYAAIKKIMTKEGAAMGYAMLYAGMNMGAFFSGLLSPPVRKSAEGTLGTNGISGVFWCYTAFTVVSIAIIAFMVTRKRVQEATLAAGNAMEVNTQQKQDEPKKSLRQWLAEHPFRDLKFVFFIFILIPVQTLFAHQWLTIPTYLKNCFDPIVADNYEFFANLNPLIIMVVGPVAAAITRKADTYKMMIIGTLIMAAPTFLLCYQATALLMVIYVILMSVGEAIWSPRFLQHCAQIAPEGKTGLYMGISQIPWFLTKWMTGLYSGWFLQSFVPTEGGGVQGSRMMWLIYGLIAIVTPAALYFARGWAGKGKQPEEAPVG